MQSNGGLIERVSTRPAVYTMTCLTAVTDSPNTVVEKTRISTRRLRGDQNTQPDMPSALCASLNRH